MWKIALAERGLVPDALVRLGIRRMLAERLRTLERSDDGRTDLEAFADGLRQQPIALATDRANQQHYEVPPAFFQHVLGARRKYSCAWWPPGTLHLDAAEERMLHLTCERAELADGMRVLDLGCGWGSLSLWIAERMPRCRVLAVSNSKLQREHILGECQRRGLANVEVRTADVNHFDTPERFDRVVSVEMFEHLRNFELLLRRIASWLAPDGKLFVHHFCHRRHAYPYETEGAGNWMGRHFFTGGMMPARDLLPLFQDDLRLEQQWSLSGVHYQKTCEAWLRNLDDRREAVLPVLASCYGEDVARLWLQRWRLFFLGCAELFGYRGGSEWFVTHLRFGAGR